MDDKPHARISAEDSGRRLIDYLAGRFTYLPEEDWRRAIAEGRVSLDGAVAAEDRPLREGEVLAFDPPELDEPEVDSSCELLFEDDDYLIADKSGNLPCHPSGRYYRHSLSRLLRDRFGEIRIATRLDRETSGLVLACRSSASASYAGRLLAIGGIEKEYLALVHGAFPSSLRARGYLLSDGASLVRLKRRFVEAVPDEGAKAEGCETNFELLCLVDPPADPSIPGPVSLIRARPLTGRTHQIRATLYSLGFPLVGDKLYGLDEVFFLRHLKGELQKEDRARLMLPNQALHCSMLLFKKASGEEISARSMPRWPAPFAEALANLR